MNYNSQEEYEHFEGAMEQSVPQETTTYGCCWESKKLGVACPNHLSPTKPDWSEEFDRNFIAKDSSVYYHGEDSKDGQRINIKSFIQKLLTSEKAKWNKEMREVIDKIHGKYALREKLIVKEVREDMRKELIEKLPKIEEKNGQYAEEWKTGWNDCLFEVKQIIKES